MTAFGAGPCTRVLITGAHGFVGARLVARIAHLYPHWRLDTPPRSTTDGQDGLEITDAAAVDRWVALNPPDVVVHLAALAAVAASSLTPRETFDVNLGGVLNLTLALKAHAPSAHLLFASSAEVYGASLRAGRPVDEGALLQPLNPYAVSKAAADLLVRQAAMAGQPATIARAFNHTGPGQTDAFVVPSFTRQIARIEAGLAPPVLRVGNLDEERDFLDVEDIVSAYVALLDAREQLAPAEVFNVASGQAVRIGDILDMLLAQADAPITVEVDPARLRPVSVQSMVGDATRLRNRVGWRPRIPLSQTLLQVLQAQRRRLRATL